MPKLLQITPFLYAEDLDATVAFLRDKLGFKLLVRYDEYAYLHRDSAGLRFLKGTRPLENHGAYLDVEDVDGLYAEFRAKLGEDSEALHNNPDGPRDQTYGQREFTVFGPERLSLFFGQEIFRDTPAWDRAAKDSGDAA